MKLYLVEVYEDGERYEYEHGCIEHAREQFNNEVYANLFKYNGNGEYTLIDSKNDRIIS